MKVPLERLPKCHITYPEEADYVIEEIPARCLLSYKRMDFYAKLLYIDHYVKGIDMTYALNTYLAHIEAVTGFTNSEKGNKEKNNGNKFVEVFNKLIKDISENGFNSSISLIPVDADNYVIDGAHRVSIAAYFDKKVTIIRFKDWRTGYSMDWKYLKEMLLEERYLDFIALESTRWHQNLYMACFWPRSFTLPERKKQADEYIESRVNILYRKKIKFNKVGIRNFLLQIYGHMSWIGNVDNHYRGVNSKMDEVVFKDIETVEFYLLQADSFDTIFNLKKEVRDIYNIGLSSVHITDNIRETRQIANLIYNPNSIHHLLHSYPDKFIKSYRLLLSFKDIVKEHNIDPEIYVLDSSMVMAIYGIREAADLDYLTEDKDCQLISTLCKQQGSMECHDRFIKYHTASNKDLIYNPHNFFVFNDIKFLTLNEIYRYKKNKGEEKDKNDIKLISAYISNDWKSRISMRILNIRHTMMVYRRRFKQDSMKIIIQITKTFRIYEFCRKMRNKLYKLQ